MADIQIQENGYQALSQSLGVKFVYFTEQFRKGTGDYTKEKYEKPDEIIDWDKLEAEVNQYQ
ncbi:MAG: hypothetical protein IJ797_06565 [Selenomonadaceae bacterium]|nr:hypothetical protein [Selenomonadaceae bacterium]